MTYDAAELARLREIAQKATPGPWEMPDEDGIIAHWDGDAGDDGRCVITKDEICTIADTSDLDTNATFIVAARKHFLSLIDALEKAQEDVDLWKGTANAVECVLVNTRAECDSARAEATLAGAVAEREECAKVAETFPDLNMGSWTGRPRKEDIAAAIRARKP